MSWISPFLNIGKTLEIFQALGKILDWKDRLNKKHKGLQKDSAQSDTRKAGIKSGQLTLLGFNFLSAPKIAYSSREKDITLFCEVQFAEICGTSSLENVDLKKSAKQFAIWVLPVTSLFW
jgi:hypothetical protein